MRLYLTEDGDALLMKALKIYSALIEKVMAQSSPTECDALGAQMRRIEDVLKSE